MDQSQDQGGLSGGNAIGICQGGDSLILCKRLGQDGALQAGVRESAGNNFGDQCFQLSSLVGVVIFHTDQDGILQIGQIAVLKHGADDSIDGSG